MQASQHDILQAFSFSLDGHNTPQYFLDEIWLALPTLRALLDFNGGWRIGQRETWERLLGVTSGEYEHIPRFFFCIPVVVLNGAHLSTDDCAEPDILRYPLSLFTISALIFGITMATTKSNLNPFSGAIANNHSAEPDYIVIAISATGQTRTYKPKPNEIRRST